MEREDWARYSTSKWPWLFDLGERFVRHANQLLTETEIGQKDGRFAMLALLFGRVISGTEALIFLSRFGFLTEADVIFRSNLEALFRLAALVEDDAMFVVYLGEDYPRRRRAMDDVRQLLASVDLRPANTVSEAELDEAIRKIDQETHSFRERHGIAKLREVKIWDWVVAGKQFDFFHGKYLMHSNAAHHAARDLERRIVPRADGEGIETINLGIDDGAPVEIVLDALLLLVRGIAEFAKAAGKDISQELLDVRAELDSRLDSDRDLQ
jgi:hypothetical protein